MTISGVIRGWLKLLDFVLSILREFLASCIRSSRRINNRIVRCFVKPSPRGKDGRLNVNLGCGKVDHSEFVNVDAYPAPHVDYMRRIDKLPWFKDNEVDLLYASHCLEHFRYLDTGDVLREWHRVLKQGGVLRISVPDFDKLVAIYRDNGDDPDVMLPQLLGGQENNLNYHYTALNRVNLSRKLIQAGFGEVREWEPGSAGVLCCDDMSTYHKKINGKAYPVCLNLEAVK